MQGRRIALGDILRDGSDRSRALPAATLLIRRHKELILLPPDDFPLAPGDELLLASSLAARHNLETTLHNPNELDYVLTGSEVSGSWLWQRFMRSGRPAAPAGEP